jgi:dGTPase
MEIWQESYELARSQFPKLKGKELTTDVIRRIIDRQVEDVIVTSFDLIKTAGVKSADEARMQKKPLIRYSTHRVQANRRLRKFLYANLYFHPRVAEVNRRACLMLKNVFKAYMKKPSLLGESTSRRVRREGLARTVCDYLSGMTDRYLLEEHRRLFAEEGMLSALGREPYAHIGRRNE